MPFNIYVGQTVLRGGPVGGNYEQIRDIQKQTLEVSDYSLPSTDQGGVIPYLLGTRIISRPSVMGYGYAANNGITAVYETKVEETTEDEQAVATMSTPSGKNNPTGWRYEDASYGDYPDLAAAAASGDEGSPSNVNTVLSKNAKEKVAPALGPKSPAPFTPYPSNTFGVSWNTPQQIVQVKNHTINTITTLAGYTFDLMLCVCLGAEVRLRKIYSGDKLLWEGDLMSNLDGNSGYEVDTSGIEGGPLGTGFVWHSGHFNQKPDAYLKSKAVNPSEVPGFPGIAYIILKNIKSEVVGQGSFSFEVTRIPEPLEIPRNITTPNERDINPAVALAMLLVDNWGGLAINNMVDLGYTFRQAAYELYYEGQSTSFVLSNENAAKGMISTLKDQTFGTMFSNPDNGGLIEYRLFRPRVDPIPTRGNFGKHNVSSIQGVDRVDWSDCPTHFKVSYSSRADKYDSKSWVEENPAMTPAEPTDLSFRSRKVTSLSLDNVCEESAAKAVMLLNMRQGGTPVWAMTLVCNRDASENIPTDRIKFTWPELNLDEALFWVVRRKEGPDNESILLDIIQHDVLDVSDYITAPGVSNAIATDTSPKPPASVRVVEIPYFLAKKAGLSRRYIMPGAYGDAIILAEPADNYQSTLTAYNADTQIPVLGGISYCSTATLVFDVDQRQGYQQGVIPVVWIDNFKMQGKIFNQGPNGVRRGDIVIFVDDEIWSFDRIDLDPDSGRYKMTNVYRALLDTTEATHVAGSKLYFYDTGDNSRIWQGGLIVNQDSRRLGFVGKSLSGNLQVSDTDIIVPFAPGGRTNAPLRPHRIKVNDRRDATRQTVNPGQEVSLRWNLRTRDTREISQVNDANDFPEIRLQDNIDLRNPVMYIYIQYGAAAPVFLTCSVSDFEEFFHADYNHRSLTFAKFNIPTDAPTGDARFILYAVEYDWQVLFNEDLTSPDNAAMQPYTAVNYEFYIEPLPTFRADFTFDYGTSVCVDFTFDYHT